jgi:hypothetical protein
MLLNILSDIIFNAQGIDVSKSMSIFLPMITVLDCLHCNFNLYLCLNICLLNIMSLQCPYLSEWLARKSLEVLGLKAI